MIMNDELGRIYFFIPNDAFEWLATFLGMQEVPAWSLGSGVDRPKIFIIFLSSFGQLFKLGTTAFVHIPHHPAI
jgi:hypothetical protein